MEGKIRDEARRILDHIEIRHGASMSLRRRLQPIVMRILESGPPSADREEMLRLVGDAYAHHMRMLDTIDMLRGHLRRRMNEVYGQVLGIEPPGVGA